MLETENLQPNTLKPNTLTANHLETNSPETNSPDANNPETAQETPRPSAADSAAATPPTVTQLGDEIYLIRSVLAPTVCQHLMQVANQLKFGAAKILIDTVDEQIRSSDMLRLGGEEEVLSATNQEILSQLPVVQQFLYTLYGVKFPYAEPCTILRYRVGQFYRRHVDNILLSSRFQEVEQGIPTRDISVVGYLNDDFEGGETYFDRQEVTVTPEQGAVLVFPAYFTHPHQALPVQKGEKYAFTSWLFH